jgi:large subunit ribosomal protein L4
MTMQVPVITLRITDAGEIELPDALFAAHPRADIMARVVHWQLAKRRAGTHKVKGWVKSPAPPRSRTSRRAPAVLVTVRLAFRSSAAAVVPSVRSFAPHAFDLPKKVRALALKHALSAKAKDGGLIVIENANLEAAKTKALLGHFSGLGLTTALIIDGAEVHVGFAQAARNIPNIDVLPIQGINVYDILRRQKLVLTKAALDALEARFK